MQHQMHAVNNAQMQSISTRKQEKLNDLPQAGLGALRSSMQLIP